MLLTKKRIPALFLGMLVVGALSLSGCHMIGAHGSLYLGHQGYYGGHGRYHSEPRYHGHHRPQHPRYSRHSHSSGRHYRY